MTVTVAELPIVIIEWHDAHSEPVSGNTWFDHQTIEPDPYPIISIGHLLPAATKPNHYSIAQSRATVDGLVDSVLHVPHLMVVRAKFLKEVEE